MLDLGFGDLPLLDLRSQLPVGLLQFARSSFHAALERFLDTFASGDVQRAPVERNWRVVLEMGLPARRDPESIAPDDIQGAAEGVYFFENFPRMLKAKNDEFHKEFNKRVGIDDVDAREIGGQRVMDKSHGWQAWEDIFALKQAIEKSGYKTRKDVEGVIQALEGMEMKNSLGHPQGDKLIRKEDHVGIIDCYISRVEGGKLEVKKRIPKEELAKNMPLRHDLSKMPA